MLLDYFRFAVGNLFKRKLRSWLTVLGIFIGIMSVVALISLSQGMQDALLSEFEKMGTDRIVISPGGANMGPVSGLLSSSKFTEEDYDSVKNVRGVDRSMSVLSETAYISYGREMKQELVWGFPFESENLEYYAAESMFELEDGRLLRTNDQYSVNIGYGVAHDMFDKEVHVGNKIVINEVDFTVVGIHSKQGGLIGDNTIRIPKDTARELFDEPSDVTAIFMKTQDGFEVSEVAERVKSKLRRFRNVKEGEEDFSVQTSEQVIKTFKAVLGIVQAVLVGIAAISLLVGGIGIMNTMYTSVVERTRDIGIMKSVGARNSAIMIIFLIESGLLGLFGGVLGVILGLGVGKGAEMIAFQYGIESLKAYMGLPLIVGALLFAFIIGAASGTLPAIQASKLNPVDALRK